MDFLELQNFVISDRFDETQRADVKRWINHRYGRIWASQAWTFKMGLATVSVSQGTSTSTAPTLSKIHALWDGTISPGYTDMDPVRPEDFYDYASTTSTIPFAYTIINNTIHFSNPMPSARTFTVLGELAFTRLVDDADEPLLPEEFHETLAHGAISEGLRMEQDPTWQAAEEDFRVGMEDMKSGYLTSVMTYNDAYPSWP